MMLVAASAVVPLGLKGRHLDHVAKDQIEATGALPLIPLGREIYATRGLLLTGTV
jgi:hypothetical protein